MAQSEDVAMTDGGQHKIPVTVLTGALGAGKTTLLKSVLEKPHGYKVAVIQNEFSETMGMEAPLFTDDKGETIKDVYELPNGCLCCSAKDGLIGMLDVLVEQRKKFDYVLVEATGIADPEAICEIFWVDDGLGSAVYLDGVVTLVDGRNCISALDGTEGDFVNLGLEHETAKQVASADVLILNKADLTTVQQRGHISARLRTTMRGLWTLLQLSGGKVIEDTGCMVTATVMRTHNRMGMECTDFRL
jgi:G3E family GTPase